MGDYYKLKKILLILIIVCTILRIINTSRVFGAEVVDPKETSGTTTIQYDNTWQTLRDFTKDGQTKACTLLLRQLDNEDFHDDAIQTINNIYHYMFAINPNRLLYFEDMQTFNNNSFIVRVFPITALHISSNIVSSGVTINYSYNFPNVPFLEFNRNSDNPNFIVNINGQISESYADGARVRAPIPMLGCYSPMWLQVFEKASIIKNSTDYEELLQNIENNQQLVLQQEQVQSAISRDTNSVVTNSYNYIKDENIEEITSLGFSSPDVEEKIDLNDVFDEIETLLTNENYVSKQFSIKLPNGNESIFSISPTLLEDNLTRVGGSNIIQIIHAIWFIGLYGWYIFAYFGILGKLISGDWFHLVKGSAPVTRLVKMSVGSITGNGGF